LNFSWQFCHSRAAVGFFRHHAHTGFDLHPTGTLSPEMMTQFANQPQAAQPNAADAPQPDRVDLPEAGGEIRGVIELTGTVNIPNFGFYKYEVAPAGAILGDDRRRAHVVIEGPLGRWDTTALTPGDYQLRLVVVDNQGLELPPCVVPVRVFPFNRFGIISCLKFKFAPQLPPTCPPDGASTTRLPANRSGSWNCAVIPGQVCRLS
jgi:hypothetical protein